jgi:hypothetical protein
VVVVVAAVTVVVVVAAAVVTVVEVVVVNFALSEGCRIFSLTKLLRIILQEVLVAIAR